MQESGNKLVTVNKRKTLKNIAKRFEGSKVYNLRLFLLLILGSSGAPQQTVNKTWSGSLRMQKKVSFLFPSTDNFSLSPLSDLLENWMHWKSFAKNGCKVGKKIWIWYLSPRCYPFSISCCIQEKFFFPFTAVWIFRYWLSSVAGYFLADKFAKTEDELDLVPNWGLSKHLLPLFPKKLLNKLDPNHVGNTSLLKATSFF